MDRKSHMNIDLQRKIDRYVGGSLCRLLSWCYFPKKKSTSQPQVKNILIILLSEMGSLVLARPMFQRLKEKYPQAKIHVLLFKKNREVLDLLDVVDPENVIAWDCSSLGHMVKDGLGLLAKLRQTKFDVVLDCELFARISSLLSYWTGAPMRVGFHPHTQEGLYRGHFITRPVLYNPYHHLSQQFLTMVDAIESNTYPKAKRLVKAEEFQVPRLQLTPHEVDCIRVRLQEKAPQWSENRKPLVLIYPSGGLLPIRAWPKEHYIKTTQALLAEGCAVGIIGMPSDKALAQDIQSHCPDENCIDLTGFTATVRELMCLFDLASLLITNDGGPGQFAALSKIPSIIFYGPETPQLYGPLDDKATVMFTNASCSPCVTAYNHRKSPCDGNNVCINRITPDQVLTKAREILGDALTVTPTPAKIDEQDRILEVSSPKRPQPDHVQK